MNMKKMKQIRMVTGALSLIILNALMLGRLVPWIRSVGVEIPMALFLLTYILVECIVIICFRKIRTNTRYIWKCVGGYGMCVYLCYAYALVLTTIVPGSVSIRGWIALFIGALLLIWGIYSARALKIKQYHVPLLEREMRLVLLSDLHMGAVGSESRIPNFVEQINALKPDVVCISGDLFDNFFASIRNPETVKKQLREIHATYGVYACLGNHDAGEGIHEMIQFLAESNIILLNDTFVTVADQLILGGRLDQMPHGGYGGMKRCNTEEFMEKLGDAELPVIILEHNPEHLDEYDQRIDLILSGHTHNGQQFPANLVLKKVYDCAYGYYQKNENTPRLIVTSGAGTWGMPLRIGTCSEIVSIALGKNNENEKERVK